MDRGGFPLNSIQPYRNFHSILGSSGKEGEFPRRNKGWSSSFLRRREIRRRYFAGASSNPRRVDILTSVFASDGSGNSISSGPPAGPSAFQLLLRLLSPLPTLLSIVEMVSKGNRRDAVLSSRDQPNLRYAPSSRLKLHGNHREDIESIGRKSSGMDSYRESS